MNKFTKTLSIALSLISLAYLPNVAAVEQTSSVFVQLNDETIINTQESSVAGWPREGGIEF